MRRDHDFTVLREHAVNHLLHAPAKPRAIHICWAGASTYIPNAAHVKAAPQHKTHNPCRQLAQKWPKGRAVNVRTGHSWHASARCWARWGMGSPSWLRGRAPGACMRREPAWRLYRQTKGVAFKTDVLYTACYDHEIVRYMSASRTSLAPVQPKANWAARSKESLVNNNDTPLHVLGHACAPAWRLYSQRQIGLAEQSIIAALLAHRPYVMNDRPCLNLDIMQMLQR